MLQWRLPRAACGRTPRRAGQGPSAAHRARCRPLLAWLCLPPAGAPASVSLLHGCSLLCFPCRDLKSKNVLLSKDGRAKISDVGTAALHSATYLSGAAPAPERIPGRPCGASPSRPAAGRCGCVPALWMAAACSAAHATTLCSCPTAPSSPPRTRCLPAVGSSKFGGTLAWAAPELLLGAPISHQSDIYSMGVVSRMITQSPAGSRQRAAAPSGRELAALCGSRGRAAPRLRQLVAVQCRRRRPYCTRIALLSPGSPGAVGARDQARAAPRRRGAAAALRGLPGRPLGADSGLPGARTGAAPHRAASAGAPARAVSRPCNAPTRGAP